MNASRNSWNGAPRNVRSIVTPRALAVYREQSGCASLQGIPIEDQPTGVNAHWEARVLGAEVMSYGTATGEVYLGDITLAFLEDTGQYKGNYAICGDLAVIDTSPPSNKASFLASGSSPSTYCDSEEPLNDRTIDESLPSTCIRDDDAIARA